MKKKILTLAVLFALALFAASCSKKCICTTTIDGKEISEVEVDKASGVKCSAADSKVTVLGVVTEVTCK